MREMSLKNKQLILKIERFEERIGTHEKELVLVFETLRKMLQSPPSKRNRIWFITEDD